MDTVLGLASGKAGGEVISDPKSTEAKELDAAVTALLQVSSWQCFAHAVPVMPSLRSPGRRFCATCQPRADLLQSLPLLAALFMTTWPLAVHQVRSLQSDAGLILGNVHHQMPLRWVTTLKTKALGSRPPKSGS